MEHYSVLKRNELSSHENTWKKLKCILLSEGSQSEKAVYCMNPSLGHSGKGKTLETVKKINGWEEGGKWTDGAQSAFMAVKIFHMIL